MTATQATTGQHRQPVHPGTPPAHPVLRFWRSAVGKKWIMAVTGIMLLGFVFAHMVGNLKIYLGAGPLNTYAEWLRNLGEPALPRTVLLWIMRIGLIGAFFLHSCRLLPKLYQAAIEMRHAILQLGQTIRGELGAAGH